MSKPTSIDATNTVEGLGILLTRIVFELYTAAQLIERVEPNILGFAGADSFPASSVKVIQGIDLAVQKTRGLAEFIDAIIGEIPSSWTVDFAIALSLVKLGEMREALGSTAHADLLLTAYDRAGDLDFF